MDYREYKPPKELTHLIECFWTNTLDENDFDQDFDLIIPDGSAEAIFMLNGNYLRKDENNGSSNLIDQCSFVPPFKKALKVYQNPDTTCLAIRFKAGAIQKLTNCCLGELEQTVYPLEALMPTLADFMMEKIYREVPSPMLVEKLVAFLINQNTEPDSNFIVSQFILTVIETKGSISISKFCADFDIHKSTLEKNFKVDTGITPKQYAKLIRFNYLLNQLVFSKTSLTEISLDLGFYDQSHMTHEFKNIVGLTPSQFKKQNFAIPKLAALAIAGKQTHYN